MPVPVLPLLLMAGGLVILSSKKSGDELVKLEFDPNLVPKLTFVPSATPVPGATGGSSTSGGHSGPSGRAYKTFPTPGYWYKVRAIDLRPIVVRAKHGSVIGVLIDGGFMSLAWRAYTPGVVTPNPKKPDLSGWIGLNPVLGGVQQLDAAFDLADEALKAIVGGFTGRFDQVAKNAGVIIQSVWKGIRAKQKAANAVVFEYLMNYAANISADPANSAKVVTNDPTFGFSLDLKVGDSIYIPKAGVYYPRAGQQAKPN